MMEAHASQFDKKTISPMRMLGALTGIEGFVGMRNDNYRGFVEMYITNE